MKKITILTCLSILLIACGKKGLPEPDLIEDLFTWQNISAASIENCISVSGQLQGNVENVMSVNMEVQGLTEACVDCSFVAEMNEVYEPQEIFDNKSNVFQLNYCPTREYDEYRLRIVGNNKVLGLPQVTSQIIILNTLEVLEKK